MMTYKKIKEHPEDFSLRVEYVRFAFRQLSEHCEHKRQDDPDCHYPDKGFDCVLCDLCNCPFLINESLE